MGDVSSLADPDNSEVTISCDLGTEPDLRKIGKQGAISRKSHRPFAFSLRSNPPDSTSPDSQIRLL
jgi:hypothetical protein